MKERIEELAALHAVGALDGAELTEFQALLSGADADALDQLSRFQNAAALLAISSAPAVQPSPGLKGRLLKRISAPEEQMQPVADLGKMAGFKFIPESDASGWVNLRVHGASVKLLSLDPVRDYAVVLGKLEPGTRYPPHQHIHAEQIFVLTGDLYIGDQRLGAGDFHHADAGTSHGVNYSEAGCTILAVISTDDLKAQMA